MQSSTGAHYIALDHVRALAIFMVVVWHFTHSTTGFPVSNDFVPLIFPLALLDEGHTGVALFMTLSGYLFAKLLADHRINYLLFFYNRALRLLPLILIIILILGLTRSEYQVGFFTYTFSYIKGLILPIKQNGLWSITTEFHFYLLLPLLLKQIRRSNFLVLGIIALSITYRFFIYYFQDGVQFLAYHTILGRIDQFLLGMVVFKFRHFFVKKHILVATVILCFMLFYSYFDWLGGMYQIQGYPSKSMIWVFIPTIEAVSYSILIAWYDNSFKPANRGISKFIGRIGDYSYFIYLFHFFFVFHAARYIHLNIMDISNFYVAVVWAFIFLLLMMPLAYLSNRFIERPFIKMRKNYVLS